MHTQSSSGALDSFDIAHLTTVHARHDTRILLKELASLAQEDLGSLGLFVQDGLSGESMFAGRVQIIGTGEPESSRLKRFLYGTARIYRAVRRAPPQIVHFHDPELIPCGLWLKLRGARVVYDVHEDLPRQISSKEWIPKPARRLIALFAGALEWLAGAVFDAVVAATPSIAARFPAQKTVLVQNYPLLDELHVPEAVTMNEKPALAVYVGGITRIRGAFEMVSALGSLADASPLRLGVAGHFYPESLRADLSGMPGWDRVDVYGWLNRKEVAGLLNRARMGLVLFHPLPNHTSAQPNKLFEYMAAGLPVIASDFPLWREIVEGAKCGILVDPLDASAIAAAMTWLLEHPNEAEAMGRRARVAVERRYNWSSEAGKLVALYRRLSAERPCAPGVQA